MRWHAVAAAAAACLFGSQPLDMQTYMQAHSLSQCDDAQALHLAGRGDATSRAASPCGAEVVTAFNQADMQLTDTCPCVFCFLKVLLTFLYSNCRRPGVLQHRGGEVGAQQLQQAVDITETQAACRVARSQAALCSHQEALPVVVRACMSPHGSSQVLHLLWLAPARMPSGTDNTAFGGAPRLT